MEHSVQMSTETVYYVKEKNKYRPVSYYDSNISDSFPEGATLVIKHKNCTMRRYGVDIAHAPVLAAINIMREELVEIIRKASEAQIPKNGNLTQAQLDAWNNLIKLLGEDARSLRFPSMYDVAEKIIETAVNNAEKYFKHPAVQNAYQHFLITQQLTKDNASATYMA